MGCGASSKSKSSCQGKELPLIKFETTGSNPSQCLILLHGFGRTGASIKGALAALLEETVNVRVLLPTAPVTSLKASPSAEALRKDYMRRRDEAVMGATMTTIGSTTGAVAAKASDAAKGLLGMEEDDGTVNTWFEDAEFESLDELLTGAPEGLVKSIESGKVSEAVAMVHSLIRQQMLLGIPAEKIIVGGHGTGAFIASRAALSFPDAQLKAIWMLNGYIGGPDVTVADAQKKLRILVTSGTEDPIVPKQVTDAAVEKLKKCVPEGEVRSESIEGMRHWIWANLARSEGGLGKVLLEYVNK